MTPLDLQKFEIALDNVFPHTQFLITNQRIEALPAGDFIRLSDHMHDLVMSLRGETFSEKIIRKVKEYVRRI